MDKTKILPNGREVPIIPPREPMPLDPNPVVAVCGECGIDISQVMYYSCTNNKCPIFPQVTC